jgi:hypothetical protein
MTQKPYRHKLKKATHLHTNRVMRERYRLGDHVAFITYGNYPRALCGIIISAQIKDKLGRPAFRVLTKGKAYYARLNAIRKLRLRKVR